MGSARVFAIALMVAGCSSTQEATPVATVSAVPVEVLPSASKGLSPQQVAGPVMGRSSVFRECFDRYALEHPGAAGTVRVWFQIAPTGRVVETRLEENTFQDAAVADCIIEGILSTTFDVATNGTSATFPFVFKAPAS
jgi:hypothetical protein